MTAEIASTWNITGVSALPLYRLSVTYTLAGGIQVFERKTGETLAVEKFNSGPLNVDAVRIRVLISGTEVRFYWDYTGPGSVPFHISRVAPPLPLAVAFTAVTTTAAVENAIIAVPTNPSTVYGANQQIEDFGSVQNPIRVRVYQISSVVGRGDYVQGDL